MNAVFRETALRVASPSCGGFVRVGFIWIMLVSTVLLSSVSGLPELPRWDEEEKALLKSGDILPGQALLTIEGVAYELLEDPWEGGREAQAALEVPEVSRVVEPIPELPDPEPLPDERVQLTQAVLGRYFERQPESYLIDAQRVLSQQESRDVNYALQQHRDVSPLTIYLYVFGENQKIPEAYWPEAVYAENLAETGEPSVILYYHYGAPERSRYHIAGGMLDGVEGWKKQEVVQNSSMKARDKSAPLSQLEDFIGQVSMRLYWIEEELHQKQRQRKAQNEKRRGEESEQELSLMDHIEAKLPFLEGLFPKVAIGGCVIILLGGVWIMWVRRRVFVFPEVESSARLGGEKGAGFGGVLSFQDPLEPPSAQRDQFEDVI